MANNNVEVLTTILSALKDLDLETQTRTLQAVVTFLNIPLLPVDSGNKKMAVEIQHNGKNEVSFSENRIISPKDFLRDKSPKTDIERIACLAYYITHYRDIAHFKTVDLSSLNTEAAQPKLSNPTVAVDNATRAGLLVQAVRGSKQLSSIGELFVQALPDRDAAKASLSSLRIRKRPSKKNSPKQLNTTSEKRES